MLYTNTPIGKIQIPEWEEAKLSPLSDDEILDRAVKENNHFVISPATFAMVENRNLLFSLQKKINLNVGFRHDAFNWLQPEIAYVPAERHDNIHDR